MSDDARRSTNPDLRPPCTHVGELLRPWRERFTQRQPVGARLPAPRRPAPLSIAQLVDCLANRGCEMSTDDYERLESGIWLPDALEPLVEGLFHCLLLSSDELILLLVQITHDQAARHQSGRHHGPDWAQHLSLGLSE